MTKTIRRETCAPAQRRSAASAGSRTSGPHERAARLTAVAEADALHQPTGSCAVLMASRLDRPMESKHGFEIRYARTLEVAITLNQYTSGEAGGIGRRRQDGHVGVIDGMREKLLTESGSRSLARQSAEPPSNAGFGCRARSHHQRRNFRGNAVAGGGELFARRRSGRTADALRKRSLRRVWFAKRTLARMLCSRREPALGKIGLLLVSEACCPRGQVHDEK
jgi:hypothetical protein